MPEAPDSDGFARQAARAVIQAHAQAVALWLVNEPGAWGSLAGQAVLAARRSRGRSLTDAERSAVWAVLWEMLMEIKQPGSA